MVASVRSQNIYFVKWRVASYAYRLELGLKQGAAHKMLIKTGQLAKRAGILPSKVRFYVREGILHPAGQTPGGYFLFDGEKAIERLHEIDTLQSKQRLTLGEIKHHLGYAEVHVHNGTESPAAELNGIAR